MLKEWLAFPLVSSEWLMMVTSHQSLFEESNLPSLHNYYKPFPEPWLPEWQWCYSKAFFHRFFLACRLFLHCSPIFTKHLQEATLVVPGGTFVLTSHSFTHGCVLLGDWRGPHGTTPWREYSTYEVVYFWGCLVVSQEKILVGKSWNCVHFC